MASGRVCIQLRTRDLAVVWQGSEMTGFRVDMDSQAVYGEGEEQVFDLEQDR
jgi:hypothetical protein